VYDSSSVLSVITIPPFVITIGHLFTYTDTPAVIFTQIFCSVACPHLLRAPIALVHPVLVIIGSLIVLLCTNNVCTKCADIRKPDCHHVKTKLTVVLRHLFKTCMPECLRSSILVPSNSNLLNLHFYSFRVRLVIQIVYYPTR